MSEVSKWVNEVQLMRKEHEKELEKERKRSKVLVEALKPFASQSKYHRPRKEKCNNCGLTWPCEIYEAEEAIKKYEEMGK